MALINELFWQKKKTEIKNRRKEMSVGSCRFASQWMVTMWVFSGCNVYPI